MIDLISKRIIVVLVCGLFKFVKFLKLSWVKLMFSMIQVGFNAGDEIVYSTVKASRTPDSVSVYEYSNVKIPRKFPLRINTSDISDGGCNTEGRFYDTVKTFSV